MQRSLDAVVDVMRVPAIGDPGTAVVAVGALDPARDEPCEILIAGGGTGGVAAALAAARPAGEWCCSRKPTGSAGR